MSDLRNNAAKSRFEIDVDGHVVFADYRLENSILYINYVEAPVELRGKGAAGKLMELIVRHAQEKNYKVIPICGYAASWLKRHDEYKHLIAI